MRRMLFVLLVLILASTDALAGRQYRLLGQSCQTGEAVVGVDENNILICQSISSVPLECTGNPPVIAYDTPYGSVVGDEITVDLSGTYDDEDDPLFIYSIFVQLPPFSQAELTPDVGVYPSFIPDEAGIYGIRVTASDGTGCSASVDIIIVVDPAP